LVTWTIANSKLHFCASSSGAALLRSIGWIPDKVETPYGVGLCNVLLAAYFIATSTQIGSPYPPRNGLNESYMQITQLLHLTIYFETSNIPETH